MYSDGNQISGCLGSEVGGYLLQGGMGELWGIKEMYEILIVVMVT